MKTFDKEWHMSACVKKSAEDTWQMILMTFNYPDNYNSVNLERFVNLVNLEIRAQVETMHDFNDIVIDKGNADKVIDTFVKEFWKIYDEYPRGLNSDDLWNITHKAFSVLKPS